MEPEYDDPRIIEIIKKTYPPSFSYTTKDLHQTRRFYEFILVDTKSAEITHIPYCENHLKIAYSNLKIFKIMNHTYWIKIHIRKKLSQNPLSLNLSATKIIRWHGSMSFSIKTTSIHVSFDFEWMLITSIIHFSSKKLEYLWSLFVSPAPKSFYYFSQNIFKNPFSLTILFSVYFQIPKFRGQRKWRSNQTDLQNIGNQVVG